MRALLAASALLMLSACGSASGAVSGAVASASPASAASSIPWAPLPEGHAQTAEPPTGTPLPVPASTPACRASQLEGILIGRYSAMSNLDAPVALRDTGSSACYLSGYADVTIVNSAGAVMASVAGVKGQGTYFDAPTVVSVLMLPNTVPLSYDTNWHDGVGLLEGQAFLNIEWEGCTLQPASKVFIGVPGGGRVAIAFDVTPNGPDVCSRDMPVSRGPFDPTGIDWSPDRHLIRIDLSISTPQPTVRAGATLSYSVTVRNASGEDYPLTPCPDYAEDLTAVKTAGWFYQLNCSPAGAVRAGASVTFQMRLDVPANAPAGATTLLWQLFDGRVLTDDYAQAPITITA